MLNGWLFPSGKFLPCEIGEHGKTARKLRPRKSSGYIHVFPRGAFSEVPPTRKQRQWLMDSLARNDDETYQDMVNMLLEK